MALLRPLPAMCFKASGCAVCNMTLVIRTGLQNKSSQGSAVPCDCLNKQGVQIFQSIVKGSPSECAPI